MRKIFFLIVFVLTNYCAWSQFYTGGNIGLSVENANWYMEIAPQFGYRMGRLDVGISPFVYYWSANEKVSFGGRLYSRLTIVEGLFAHGEFEVAKNVMLKDKKRSVDIALPVGVGYSYKINKKTTFTASVLYNVLDDGSSMQPNPSYRAGINYDF